MERRDSYSCDRKLRLAPIPLRDGTFLLEKNGSGIRGFRMILYYEIMGIPNNPASVCSCTESISSESILSADQKRNWLISAFLHTVW